MQTVRILADIAVQDRNGNVLALVEIKNLQDLSPHIASKIRRNLLAHGLMDSRYFMIVSQEVGYLWDQYSTPTIETLSPTAKIPVAPIIEHYLPSLSGGRLSSSQLELAVTQWLWDMANDSSNRPREPEDALEMTDFPRLIRDGRVDADIQR